MKYFYSLIIACVLSFSAYSQNMTDLFNNARNEFAEGNYENAIIYYNQILDQKPKLAFILAELGDAYRLNFEYNNAIEKYEEAVKISKNINPESIFWYAELLQQKGKSEDSRKMYALYLSKQSLNKAFENKAKNSLLQNINIKSDSTAIVIERDSLSPFIHNFGISWYNNLRYYNGLIIENDTSFITIKPELNAKDTILSKLWNKKNIIYSNFSVSHSDTSIHYTIQVQEPNSTAKKYQYSINSKTTKNISASMFNNLQASYIQFSEIKNMPVVFFAANYKGGNGGLDIWYSYLLDNNTLSEPLHTGIHVNSIGDEICPFFDSKNNILYFSSEFHNSLGGFDIFYSKYANGRFEKPVNMQFINSTYNEYYYTQIKDKSYFVSNKELTSFNNKLCNFNKVYTYATPIIKEIKDSIIVQAKHKSTYADSVWTTNFYFADNIPQANSLQHYKLLHNMCLHDWDKFVSNEKTKTFSIAQQQSIAKLKQFFSNEYINSITQLENTLLLIMKNPDIESIIVDFKRNEAIDSALHIRRVEAIQLYITDFCSFSKIPIEYRNNPLIAKESIKPSNNESNNGFSNMTNHKITATIRLKVK